MYVCMYVCMYVSMYVCMYVCAWVRTVCLYAYMRRCVPVCVPMQSQSPGTSPLVSVHCGGGRRTWPVCLVTVFVTSRNNGKEMT